MHRTFIICFTYYTGNSENRDNGRKTQNHNANYTASVFFLLGIVTIHMKTRKDKDKEPIRVAHTTDSYFAL